MLLEELTLKNFRNHRDLTLTFQQGVNGIVGSNGAGKSSIIEAIQFVYTGEGNANKDRLVTTGSMGQSYVRAKFRLNDKEGTIERHVNSSKVELKYDGLELVKSTEVKELWAKLLQIDSHIFKHVIIAHQKKIPELLSGDNSVREKAFQKIFLVPNTETLRNTIWNNYIKSAPPPFSEEDVTALTNKQVEFETRSTPIENKIVRLKEAVLPDNQVIATLSAIEYFKKCIQDAENKPVLEQKLSDIAFRYNQFLATKMALETSLSGISHMDLVLKRAELLPLKTQYTIKLQYQAEISLINSNFVLTEDDYLKLQEMIRKNKEEELELTNQISVVKSEMLAYEAYVNQYNNIKGKAECPTCGQSLESAEEFLRHQAEGYALDKAKLDTLTNTLNVIRNTIKSQEDLAQNHKWLLQRLEIETKKLARYEGVEFNQTDLDNVEAQIKEYERIQGELASVQNNIVKLESEYTVIQERLNNFTTYNGTVTPAEELTMMNEVIQIDRKRKEDLVSLEKDAVQLRIEISLVKNRIKESIENREKNVRREAYLEKLKTVYETFHVTQFPRSLIQTYSSEVEEELVSKLEQFNLPYSARIIDGFKIEMVTSEGKVVPDLSGGQEMMVGICLRLALHSMFSQSFPMLVIDEGTTHMDPVNVRLYFDCIRELRNKKTIKQVIIIDHNVSLAEVVDHVIQI